eukprot:CAMPEP_0174259986 /NCGR_PEP_ID=MMETSP0439-20130205/8733_1 /TAXON_ID=0 /ORGANISM="Stereomyxa ramosa, Strain Chinc5" /LENGTH=261 /DNA_ID=CAMNT_0015344095 /DNA_START=51 /DNA_END=836 /DNA_ORIENTATION=+
MKARPFARTVNSLLHFPRYSITPQSTRFIRTSVPSLHEAFAQHRNTPENNVHTPFDFTEENMKEIKRIVAKYPKNYQRSAISPVLALAQKQCGGWLPLAAMNKTAKVLDVPEMWVYEVATFYTMFNREPMGKYHLQVCTTTPCNLGGVGSKVILETVKEHLGIKVGGTTKDKLFTLSEVECLGACANAPMIQINEKYYENLTPETTKKLLEAFQRGEEPKHGPQNGQRVAEGPNGKTTLFDPLPTPQELTTNLDKKEEEKK